MGEGGGFPRVRAMVSLVSPELSVACPNTKGVLECELTNLLVGFDAMKATSKFRTCYKPPLYHDWLDTYLLKQSKVNVFIFVIEKTQNFIHKYGATICFHGCDNFERHPLLNMMFAYPNGMYF